MASRMSTVSKHQSEAQVGTKLRKLFHPARQAGVELGFSLIQTGIVLAGWAVVVKEWFL